jgi:hypothetical protein
MNEPTTKAHLLEALADLELALETPVIPGEMERWTAAVGQALDAVEPLLVEAIDKEHAHSIDQISQEDPGLLHVAGRLTEGDHESLQSLKKFRNQLGQLARGAERVEPDEARLETPLEKFINAGLGFIIHVRKQEAALDTWLVEALNRDRGVVD